MPVSFFLRLALAFAFLYPPISALVNPDGWIWFVPDFVTLVLPKIIFLHAFGILEVLIACGVLFMKDPVIPAVLACLVLLAIIVLDWSAFDATFRDVSILLAGVALISLRSQGRTQ